MTNEEVQHFIMIMKEIREDWTAEQVMEEYGDLNLREALNKRLNKMQTFYNYVDEVVRPEAEALGLWPSNPSK